MLSIATSYATSYQQAQVTHGWHWDAMSLQLQKQLASYSQWCSSYLSVLAGQHAQQGPPQAVLWKDKLQTHVQVHGNN